MADALLEINADDIDDVIRAIGAAEREFGNAAKAGNLVVAQKFERWARADARGFSPMTRHFADALQGSSTRSFARLTIAGRKKTPTWGAWGAFYGSKGLSPHKHQFEPWVGKSWPYAVRSQGPYSVNATLAVHIDDMGELLLTSREKAMRKVVPL